MREPFKAHILFTYRNSARLDDLRTDLPEASVRHNGVTPAEREALRWKRNHVLTDEKTSLIPGVFIGRNGFIFSSTLKTFFGDFQTKPKEQKKFSKIFILAKLTLDLFLHHFNSAFHLFYTAGLLYFDLRASVMFCVCGLS